MGKTSSSSHHPADDSHGAHGAVEETEEQRRDRARSREVELALGRALRIPGVVLSLAFAALSLAWLASLGHSAPRMSWPWLLLLVFLLAWSLALSRGGRPEPEEPQAPPSHH